MSPPRVTLFDKVWNAHVVRDLGEGWALLHIDRHLLHDLSGPPALIDLAKRRLPLHDPSLAFATPDHLVSTAPGGAPAMDDGARIRGAWMADALMEGARGAGVRHFDRGTMGHGIVHVMGPELGLVLPGLTVICGDSHTCTNGALGALAFGVGTSESTQALATQVLRQQRPKQMRIRIDGALAREVTAKDLALALIGRFGAAAGSGHAIEFAGSTVRSLPVEARLTLCNLSVEIGARFGMIAPDDATLAWLAGRPLAPRGEAFERASRAWRDLSTDDGAYFDRDETFDACTVTPTVTWGTSPEHAIGIDGRVPDPDAATTAAQREAWRDALDYMGLTPRAPIAGTLIDWVFIGSCANGRLSDLRDVARIANGRKVAPGVNAWIVPGSEQVRRDAEAEGLHRIFEGAGFAWRTPGCSLCVAANGERVPPGARCVSTSNRNFVGRQGPGARTHLASPVMAAAAAVTGRLTDLRAL